MEKDFALEVCRRLPLAEAVFRVSQFALNESFLEGLFDRHRGGSFERVISFPLLVRLIGDALFKHQGSGHQSFSRASADGSLPASMQAMYGKLARVPLPLSMGFLADTTARLKSIFPDEVKTPVPTSLAAFTVVNIDGKKLKHLQKRLKPTRRLKGEVLGGKLVVAMSQQTGLALAFGADVDGERSDAPLMPSLLEQIRAKVPGQRLFVADRQYSDLNQPQFMSAHDDHFVIRHSAKLHFHVDDTRAARDGLDEAKRPYREDWGWIGKPKDPRRRYVRRISLGRESDKEDVTVLTDLLDADQHPAVDVLEVYRHRWDIEKLFQRVTEVFNLRELIGSTPQATVFQAAFCFVMANLITLLRGYLAQSKDMQPDDISSYQLFYDVHRQLVSWTELLKETTTLDLLGEAWSAEQLRRFLSTTLPNTWTDRWIKSKRSHHPPPTKPKRIPGGHTSVHRLLEEEKRC